MIHIWDHVELRTITEIRKEQFGSYISLLSFSPKADDHLLLVVSRDRPQMVLFIDWQHNELIYSITVRRFHKLPASCCFTKETIILFFQCKSDKILSMLFVFEATEWIACISQQHVLFYHINWSLRPLRMLERREAEVQVSIDDEGRQRSVHCPS